MDFGGGLVMNAVSSNGVHVLPLAMRIRITRALFLDFDGVLHPPRAIAGARPPLSPAQIRAGWPTTFEHVGLLAEQLQGHHDVGVVVCSSWRMYLDDDALGSLLQPLAAWYAGSTGLPYQPRDVAIQAWLQANDIRDFTVIDDNVCFFPGAWPTLIVCDTERGLDDPAVLTKLSIWLTHPLQRHP
jgi:hypothetical protein